MPDHQLSLEAKIKKYKIKKEDLDALKLLEFDEDQIDRIAFHRNGNQTIHQVILNYYTLTNAHGFNNDQIASIAEDRPSNRRRRLKAIPLRSVMQNYINHTEVMKKFEPSQIVNIICQEDGPHFLKSVIMHYDVLIQYLSHEEICQAASSPLEGIKTLDKIINLNTPFKAPSVTNKRKNNEESEQENKHRKTEPSPLQINSIFNQNDENDRSFSEFLKDIAENEPTVKSILEESDTIFNYQYLKY
jgi:hypothetical protein